MHECICTHIYTLFGHKSVMPIYAAMHLIKTDMASIARVRYITHHSESFRNHFVEGIYEPQVAHARRTKVVH